jgi:hypothetical protein
MNCRQAKADIALWIGEDLPDRDRREELRRHVSACASCRQHYRRLKGTLQVLEHADREQTYDVSDSVWPALSQRIEQQAESGLRRARFNGWLPFVAMTAACVALVVVMETQGPPAQSLDSNPLPGSVFDFGPLFPGSSQFGSPQTSSTGGREAFVPSDKPSSASVPDESVVAPENSSARHAPAGESF